MLLFVLKCFNSKCVDVSNAIAGIVSLRAGSEQLWAHLHKTKMRLTRLVSQIHSRLLAVLIQLILRTEWNGLNITFTISKSPSFWGIYYYESLNGTETNSHIIN